MSISVIIVTYNSSDVIADCVVPLNGVEGVEVIVVDNASSDGTLDVVRDACPDARIIAMNENLGFSRAVNIAASQARHRNIMLLNPDAVLERDSLLSLESKLTSRNQIVAPLVEHPSDRYKVLSAGAFPTLWRVFCHYSGASRLARYLPGLKGQYLFRNQLHGASVDVDWVSGACLLTSQEVWHRLNGLSERWFMYAEDIEFCWRAKLHGTQISLHSDVQAQHLVGGSDRTGSFSANPAWIVNLYDFYVTSMRPNVMRRLSWRIVVAAGLMARSLGYAARGRMLSDDAALWNSEAKRFALFARALLS